MCDAETIRLVRAAGLWARLLSLPQGCFAGRLAHFADQHPSSWVSCVARDLSCAGVAHPVEWGVHSSCAQGVVKRWLRHAQLLLTGRSNATYASGLNHVDSLQYSCSHTPSGSRCRVCTSLCIVATIKFIMFFDGVWLGVAIMTSRMAGPPVIVETPLMPLAAFAHLVLTPSHTHW